MKFAELPASIDSCRPLFDQIQSIFTGEFEKTIVQGNGTSQCLFVDQDLMKKVQIPTRGISELDRLSYVVRQIDCDCHIVPRGSVK